ncbi:hypothetical protein NQ314_010277 [Rhamnusium bicolor]|uniref:Uncharacterized protein n=1 Tax=Rhamnusium bicolor TaxID=1586634 RepID=A0AAV8XT72_9CUCU|nr:hypothetical protein NQ314_010277 [Rhamnusium bicolor]
MHVLDKHPIHDCLMVRGGDLNRLKKALNTWDIPLHKIIAAVTDNSTNIVKALQIVVGTARHLPCFAHTLDLIPQKVCDSEVTRLLIQAVKSIVRFFKQSNTASDELRKIQKSTANNQSSLRFIQSVPTRWNSTFYMLERFIALFDMVILLRCDPK